YHLVAVAPGLHPCADDSLCAPLRFRAWRDRIELSRIDEIDATREGKVHLRVAFLLGVLLPPCHRTKTYARNNKIGAAEAACLHESLREVIGADCAMPGQ